VRWAVRPTPLVLAFSAIYALCFTLIKASLRFAPPLLFAGLRILIGGVVLLALLAILRRPLLPGRGAWPWIAALAATTTLTFAAMFLSPGRTSAGIASVLGNLQPLLVIVLAAAFLGEPLSRRMVCALALGLGGVTLIAAPALVGPAGYGVPGAALALMASAGAAGGSVIMKRMAQPGTVLLVTAWQLVLGSLPLLLGAGLIERSYTLIWDPTFVAILLFLGVLGTALPTAGLFRRRQGGAASRSVAASRASDRREVRIVSFVAVAGWASAMPVPGLHVQVVTAPG
jgi:drug/metabolite transporter (DMT)-like permease